MSAGLIITLEFLGGIGVVIGLAVWELCRLRRDKQTHKDETDRD
ncbi:hypothetical protein QTI66_16630 [Variovorax sp. J22R133]|nr:hypothetical protein [Variovorax sp. J22R133]MDM0113787.1 hypothetical protein [Variovorax sp. J22R133]